MNFQVQTIAPPLWLDCISVEVVLADYYILYIFLSFLSLVSFRRRRRRQRAEWWRPTTGRLHALPQSSRGTPLIARRLACTDFPAAASPTSKRAISADTTNRRLPIPFHKRVTNPEHSCSARANKRNGFRKVREL